MNELKIIITAANSAAKKAVKEVRDEIEKTSKSAKQNGKSISDSMKTIAKGAAVAVGAITAITTALVAFGKSSLEAQKNISKLNAAFQAAGGTTKQAGETYKNLYRFMGDSGAATEAAQQLALITTEEKKLAEWTKILQGVYATMGSTLPIESLAEAANETINVGKVTGTFADALNWAKVSEDEFNVRLAQTTSLSEREALVRSTLNGIYMNAANIYERNNQALLANAESQARLDIALAQAGRAILPLMTAVNNLATTLLTVLRPAFEIVAGVIAIFVEYIIIAVKWISAFFSVFSGGSKAKDTTKEVANNVSKVGTGAKIAAGGVGGLGGALNKAASAAKELRKQTMGFDELNVVSKQETSSASGGGGAIGGGGGGGIPLPDMSSLTEGIPDMEEFMSDLEEVKKKAEGVAVIIASIAGALLLWKVADFIGELIASKKLIAGVKELVEKYGEEAFEKAFGKTAQQTIGEANQKYTSLIDKLKLWGGLLMVVAGAILLVQGYSDAWLNGLDWANFGVILAGIGLIAGGLALAFGPIAAGVGLVAGGIALLVLGIKDLVTNGFSMEAMLAVVGGVILVCVGAVLAFNAALLANPITWVVIAIAALVAAIVVCITHWDEVKEAAKKAWDWIKEKWGILADWFSEKVVEPIKNFFSGLWTKITEIFGSVKEWFSEKFQQAWDGIKGIWNGAGDWFKGIWGNLKDAFGDIKAWFKEKFSNAWQAVKDVFSNWGSFFSGLWDTIKTTFSSLGTKLGESIGGAVKTGINSVIGWIEKTINKAIGLINGAIDLINKLPGVSVGKLSTLTLPRLAKGGVVDTATIAMIGEAGKEAVVPLENNTQWMDTLADRIAARSQNPTKVILKVGEKELGWATIGAINGITEQTGGLQLVL